MDNKILNFDEFLVEKKKPSAGLTKKQKSSIVKKAKAGKDIGKPGKGFEKVANKATKKYGSKEKGEKVAAAAMWKNIKESIEHIEKLIFLIDFLISSCIRRSLYLFAISKNSLSRCSPLQHSRP